jgi:uncharacterized membrane protein
LNLTTALLIVLEYGHIISAMGWLGGGILTTFVLGPNVGKLPPPASLQFNAKVLPKLIRFVQMMVGSTLLFGLLLYYFYVGGDFASFMATTEGMTLTAGIALALVAGVIGLGVTIPAFNKVSRIANEMLESGSQTPPPELKKYGTRARRGALTALVLLLIVLAAMVAAGY